MTNRMAPTLQYAPLPWDSSLFETAIENCPDAVVVTTGELESPGPTIVYVNAAFCRMTGYSAAELIGNSPRILQGPKTDLRVTAELRESLSRLQPFFGSTTNYRKDGTPYTVEWSITPTQDIETERVHFLSIQRAVDDRTSTELDVETILRAAPVGVLLVDPDGTIEMANALASETFGYSPEGLHGMQVDALVPESIRHRHAGHRARFIDAAERDQSVLERTVKGQCRDGSCISLEVGLSPVTIGGSTKTLASVVDISKRARAKQASRSCSRQQAALIAFAKAASQSRSPQALYQYALSLITGPFGFEAALLIKLSAFSEAVNVIASTGLEEMTTPSVARALLAQPFSVKAIETANAIISNEGIPPDIPLGRPGLISELVCVPVLEPDRQWGLLYAFSEPPCPITNDDLQSLTALALSLASVTRLERDRRHAQAAKYLRRVSGRVAHLGGWSLDLETQDLLWSDELCAIHDVPPGCTATLDEGVKFYVAEDRSRIQQLVDECIRNGSGFDEEAQIITAKGRRRVVRAIGEAVRGPDGVIHELRGALQDITDQRQVEDSLAQSRQHFRHFAEAMPNLVWTAEPDGSISYVSGYYERLTGITCEALKDDVWLAQIHPDDRARCIAAWQRAVSEGAPYEIDLRQFRAEDGVYRWHHVSAYPAFDDAGRVRKWYGSALDIHAQKELESELRRSKAKLENTLESITDGFFTLDDAWRFTYFNSAAERQTGKQREKVLGQFIWKVFPEIVGTASEREYRYAMVEQVTRFFEDYIEPWQTWFENHIYPMANGLTVYFRDITSQKNASKDIEFLAYHDHLTELPNRRLFSDRLSQLLDGENTLGGHQAVILLDLDHFKTLNDTLGHARGDKLLIKTAQRLRVVFPQPSMVARLGGDEFAIILAGLPASPSDAADRAICAGKELVEAFRQPFEEAGLNYQRTCSVGITLVHQRGDSVEEIMKRVDLALYRAKNLGRNTLSLFDPSLQESADALAFIERNLFAGIESGQFVPYYQPKMSADGKCIGAEALVRWQHPDLGRISPGEFIPIAEETGLITALGRAVLRNVCEHLVVWASTDRLSDLVISVNVSPRQFQEPGFLNDVKSVLADTGANPSRLRFEVTESLLVENLEETVGKMDALRALGITFSIDDFGTGYSSLYYLKRLPLDELKIDQTFVYDMLNDSTDLAIVQTIISLAKSLGLSVLAEGVETVDVREALIAEGCRTFQGYLFSPPVPAPALEAYLEDMQIAGTSPS